MLESIASDVVDNYGNNFQTNLVLNDVVKNPVSAVEGLLFWRYADEPNAEFKPMGTATVGLNFIFPFEFPDGREIELSVVAKTANGEQSAVNPLNGKFFRFAPNRETGTPDFSQDGLSQNARLDFKATGFTVAKFLKIQIADDPSFTTNVENLPIIGNSNEIISPMFFILRTGDLTGTKTIWVRIAYSTNSLNFGDWSVGKEFIFADSGGSGGSSGGNPPSHLWGSVLGSSGTLYWQNNGGSSSNIIYNNGEYIDSVFSSTDFYPITLQLGWNSFVVSNDDGSTNTWVYYHYGYES